MPLILSRIGPWLLWMNMGGRLGQLIYSATGQKVASFEQLPQLLQDQIETQVPLYRNAPSTRLQTADMTSWAYFKQHFQAYLSGERFPVRQVNEIDSL
jgi:hypothetical protein